MSKILFLKKTESLSRLGEPQQAVLMHQCIKSETQQRGAHQGCWTEVVAEFLSCPKMRQTGVKAVAQDQGQLPASKPGFPFQAQKCPPLSCHPHREQGWPRFLEAA